MIRTRRKNLLLLAGTLALAACAADGTPPKSASDKPAKGPAVGMNNGYAHDPFPSTYRAYPGAPTLVRNVTDLRRRRRADRQRPGAVRRRQDRRARPDRHRPRRRDRDRRHRQVGHPRHHRHPQPSRRLSQPRVQANSDGNEATSPVTADVWAEHSVWPQDPGFGRALANGGVTTLQILPGSANLFGGRSVVLKNVYARTMQGMKFPGAPYGLKMACGENPKRVYGQRNTKPSTRMGNVAVDRATWAQAVAYRRSGTNTRRTAATRPTATSRWTRCAACCRARSACRTIATAPTRWPSSWIWPRSSATRSPRSTMRSRRTRSPICSRPTTPAPRSGPTGTASRWRAIDGIGANLALLQNAGACGMIHSDDENGIQRLNQEVAKAQASGRRAGIDIPDAVAWEWLATTRPRRSASPTAPAA